MLNSYSDILTVPQVAEILGIGKNTAYHLIRNGTIHCIRIGKAIRVPKSCVVDYINSVRYIDTRR